MENSSGGANRRVRVLLASGKGFDGPRSAKIFARYPIPLAIIPLHSFLVGSTAADIWQKNDWQRTGKRFRVLSQKSFME